MGSHLLSPGKRPCFSYLYLDLDFECLHIYTYNGSSIIFLSSLFFPLIQRFYCLAQSRLLIPLPFRASDFSSTTTQAVPKLSFCQ